MTTKDLTLKTYELEKPQQLVQMATVLKKHIVGHNLFTNIQGKNYAHVEGWQFGGFLLGLLPIIKSVENLSTETSYKWRADVEIVDKNGRIVSTGIAVCSNQEKNKKSFDEYAVLSMAQTRAIGKSYRNLIGWVMKLAGYEATPSEEVDENIVKEKKPTVKEKVEPVVNGYEEKIITLLGVDKNKVVEETNKLLGTKYMKLPDDLQRVYTRLLQVKNANGNK